MKKLLSLFLVFTMLLSVVPVQALAEAEETTELLAQVDEMLTLTQDTLTETVSEWEESSTPAETTSDNAEDAFVEEATDNEPTDSPDTQDSAATPAEGTANSEMPVETPMPEEEPNADPGHGYLIFQSSCTWEQAQEYCENLGAHLAVITDEYEQEYIASLVAEAGVSCWIGSRREEDSSSYYWVTGESFSYKNWDGNEPSFYSAEDETAEVERFVGLINSPDELFPWQDLKESTDEIGGFVCEWDEDYPYEDDILAAGYCDNDVSWVLYESGELVVSGTGTLPYYEDESNAPWGRYADQITGKTIPTHIQTETKTETSEITEEAPVLAEAIAEVEDVSAEETTEEHSYRIYRISATWEEAKAYCESLSGHLATITSSEEQQLITDMVTRFGYCCWLGASRAADSDDYNWVTGEDFTYTCWADGEPSCLAPDTDEMYLGTYTNVKWNDFSSSTSTVKGFICEWDEADAVSDDVIVAGECGDALTWTLKTDGTLVIEGEGDMTSWSSRDSVPWYILASEICALSLPEGLTSIGNYAFRDCVFLTEVTLPETITSIGNSAFNGCSQLQTIVIPDPVTTIGEWAFSNCSALSSVTLSNALTTLKGGAFYNCDALTDIHIPASITTVSTAKYNATDYGPFGNCDGLKVFTLDDDATTIPANLFYGCTGLETLVIPECVTSIGGSAFRRCTNLTSISLPETLATLGSYAFDECSALPAIVIPASLETIGNYSFQSCTALNSITISNGTTTIGAYAFGGCSALQAIVIPDSVTSIGNCAFSNCTALADVNLSKNLITLGGRAFYNCDALTDIHIPASITSVGTAKYSGTDYGPFGNCDGLKTFTLDDDATTIPANLFYGCTGLETLVIPESVTSIGNAAFYNCTNLVDLTLPEDLITLGSYAFNGCSALAAILIPASVETISSYAFCDCSSLADVTLSNGTATIDAYAFGGCSALQSIVIPGSVTSIGNCAFSNCTALADVTLSKNLTTLGGRAFYNCDALTDIHIPASITSVSTAKYSGTDYGPFGNCDGLKSFTLDDDATTIPANLFYGCTGLETLVIPEGITTIGNAAFYNCTGLAGMLEIPNSVVAIGKGAFSNASGVTAISLGSSTATITTASGTSHAFYGMTGVTEVILTGLTPPEVSNTDYDIFKYFTALETVYVPAAAYEAYETAYGDVLTEGVTLSTDTMQVRVLGLKVLGTYSHTVVLSWDAHIDEDVTGYIILRDGTEVGTTENCTYADRTAEPGQTYTYTVVGCAADRSTTAGTDVSATTALPAILSICTTNEYLTLSPLDHTLYASVVNTGNMNDFEGSSPMGKFYYIAGEEQLLIGEAMMESDLSTDDTAVFSTQWDVSGFESSAYEVVFTITDIDGESASATQTIQIDNDYPEKIVSVTATGALTSIYISWTIAAEIDTTGYRIYRSTSADGPFVLIASVTDRETLTYADKTAESDCIYYYYVTGANYLGLESVPSDIVCATLSPDATAPTVTKLTPADGRRISGNTSINMTAQDDLSVTTCELSYSTDSGQTWTVFATGTGCSLQHTLDTTAFADGELQIKAIARDAAGNESDALIRTYTVDNTGPEKVTGLAYTSTATTVTLSWENVSDEDILYYRVESKNGNDYAQVGSTSKTLGINITKLTPDTEYIYRVIGYDTNGNRGIESDDITVRTLPDEIAPVVSKLLPAAGYYNDHIDFSVTATDNHCVESITIQASTDEQTWTDLYTENYSDTSTKRTFSYTIYLDSYEEGPIYLRAVIADSSGNISDTSESAPFVQYIVDRTAPTMPENVSAEGQEGRVEIRWTQGSESDLGTYCVYRSDSQDGEFALLADNIRSINYYDRTAEDNMVYYYRVGVCDQAGNESELSEAVSAQSSPDETAPVIHSVYPDSGSTIGQNNNVISALVSDNRTLNTVSVSYRTDENEEYADLSSAGGIDDYSYTLKATIPLSILEDGSTIYVRVTAEDASGNICESWDGTYYIDKTAPVVAEVAAAYLEEGSVCVSWTGGGEADLSHYSVYRRLVTEEEYSYIGRVAPGENTNHSLTDDTIAAASTSYIYKIEATDLCGNTASAETDAVFTADRSAPNAVLNCESTMQVGVEYLFDASLSTDDSEIVSYHIDLGNGVTSADSSVVGTYAETGIYTATLTVTDDSGNETTIQREITVVERSLVGTIRIQVVDEDGNPVSGAPVYFDLDKGVDERVIRNTDGNGYATFTAPVGTHYVGCIIPNNEWQPVTKNVVVTAGEETTVTMTMVHQTLVDGQFEITRMTFDEIIAAGIDVTDPENQYYVHIDITLTYGSVMITGRYTFNSITGESLDGEDGQFGYLKFPTPKGDVGSLTLKPLQHKNGEFSLLVLEIPVDVTSLKEFFDVRLHIINNASSQFSMYDNTVILDLPSGLSIVETDTTAASKTVEIAEIPGQTTQTIQWILRGDEVGTYTLGADYTGILSVFETPISARFESETPIEVYGMNGLTLRVEIPETIEADSNFYYNLELINNGEYDVYMPNIDTIDLPRAIDFFDKDGNDIYDEAIFSLKDTVLYELSPDLEGATRILPVGASLKKHYSRIVSEKYEDVTLALLSCVYEMQNTYGLQVEIVTYPQSYFTSNRGTHPLDHYDGEGIDFTTEACIEDNNNIYRDLDKTPLYLSKINDDNNNDGLIDTHLAISIDYTNYAYKTSEKDLLSFTDGWLLEIRSTKDDQAVWSFEYDRALIPFDDAMSGTVVTTDGCEITYENDCATICSGNETIKLSEYNTLGSCFVFVYGVLDKLAPGEYYVYLSPGAAQTTETEGSLLSDEINGDDLKFNISGMLSIESGTFEYVSNPLKETVTGKFNYDESWFFEDSSIYNHDLAKMSARLALTGWDVSLYMRNLFEQMEFDDIKAEFPASEANSVGYVIGHKTVIGDDGETFELISFSIRGRNYSSEWWGNFNVGDGTVISDHYGFTNAATTAYNALISYIEEYMTDDVEYKIWITGYSRSAALANLVTRYYNERILNHNEEDMNDVFTYCFATPMGAANTDNRDINIFNILNFNDAVPAVPINKKGSADWVFGRYGTTYYIPDEELSYSYDRSLYYQMLAQYSMFVPGLNASELMDDILYAQGTLVQLITQNFPLSRAGYQDVYVRVCNMYDSLEDIATGKGTLKQLSGLGLVGIGIGICAITAFYATGIVSVSTAVQYIGDKLIAELEEELMDKIMDEFYDLAFDEADGSRKYGIQEIISAVSAAHYLEGYIAWMDVLDGADDYYINCTSRLLSTNCPVDIAVYDSNGVLVAQFINDQAQEIECSSIFAYMDSNGQKRIILPDDEEFHVEIYATGDGVVNYQVEEYSIETGLSKRIVNYYDVGISKGDTLSATVENLDIGNAEYPLYKDGIQLEPSLDAIGNDIMYYSVTTTASGDGTVSNGGNYTEGEYAKVKAVPGYGCTFKGWYISNNLVSSDCEYRFRVEQDTVLTARFDNPAPGDINADTKVDILDVVRLTRHLAGDEVDYSQSAADVNSDGIVNTVDLVHLMKYLIGDPNTKL